MKRISKEIFCNGDYETAVAIRIENGEFAFLGDMEEWSDSPDWNIPGKEIQELRSSWLLMVNQGRE